MVIILLNESSLNANSTSCPTLTNFFPSLIFFMNVKDFMDVLYALLYRSSKASLELVNAQQINQSRHRQFVPAEGVGVVIQVNTMTAAATSMSRPRLFHTRGHGFTSLSLWPVSFIEIFVGGMTTFTRARCGSASKNRKYSAIKGVINLLKPSDDEIYWIRHSNDASLMTSACSSLD